MLYMSKNTVVILGYSLDEINNIGFNNIINKGCRRKVKEAINYSLAKNNSYKIKYSLNHKSGKTIWIEEYGKGVFEEGILQYIEGYMQDITADHQKQEELIELKDKYKMMADNSVDCIWQMDKKLRFTYLSPSLFQISGYQPEEWIGTPLYKHAKWTRFAKMGRLALTMIKEYKTFGHITFETWMINKEGKEFPVEISSKPLIDKNGKLIGLQGTTREISNRIEYRKEINALTERLVIANKAIENGIFDWNLNANELFWDDTMFNIYGISKDILSNNYLNWKNAVLPDEIEKEEAKIQKAIREKGIYESQFRIKHPTKGLRYIKAFAKYIELNEPHLIGINYDNTQRVEERLKLIRSEQQFRNLFEQNNDIISIMSPNGKIQNMNSIGLHVFGLDLKDLKNYSFADFTVNPKDRKHSADLLIKLQNHEPVHPYHKKFKIRENRICDFEVTVSPIYNETEELVQVVTILRDISMRIEYEEEILRQSEKARESDRLKSAFLMNMSHEIRTPLNAIIGFTDILKSYTDDENIQTYIAHIQQGGTRLLNTVTDILDASLIQQNQLVLSNSIFNLNDLLTGIYESKKKLYQNNLFYVDFKFVNDCSSSEILLLNDEERLYNVLGKIIDNAFKFNSQGEIQFGCTQNKNNIVLFVKDDGIGIEPNKIEEVFSFFRQGDDSLNRGYEGLGLGLPIVKNILRLMGYFLNIESETGKGTTVFIVIPKNQIITTKPFELSLQSKTQKTIEPESKTILIVEDDSDSAKFLEVILKSEGVESTIARDGESCLKLINTKNFYMALVDIKLPDISGFDLIPIIKQKIPECKIVVQSAFAAQTDIEKALNLGADDYLTKPIDRKKVLKMVE